MAGHSLIGIMLAFVSIFRLYWTSHVVTTVSSSSSSPPIMLFSLAASSSLVAVVDVSVGLDALRVAKLSRPLSR